VNYNWPGESEKHHCTKLPGIIKIYHVAMNITVEFTGISRVLTGQPGCTVPLGTGGSIQDVVIALAKHYPALLGEIIEKNGKNLIATNVFSLNGKKILHEGDLQYQPNKGDKLILLSLLAGG
jgi:molybdopterin converting factor small subunit